MSGILDLILAAFRSLLPSRITAFLESKRLADFGPSLVNFSS